MSNSINKTPKSQYYCYFLISLKPGNNNKTYIGITNNLKTRLDCHNGIKKNGAKSTAGGDWVYHTIVGVFPDRGTAQSFEWYWKHIQTKNGKWYRNKPGLKSKMSRLLELLLSDEWKKYNIIIR